MDIYAFVYLMEEISRIDFYPIEGPELEPFVVGSLIQLLCCVTKFGWLDDDRFEEVNKEAMNFLCQVMTFFFLFSFCLFVCFVLFDFVLFFFHLILMIASRKYVP